MSGPLRAVGYAMVRASRWLQRRFLGLRVPACRIREEDLERRLFQADEKVRQHGAALAYWQAQVAEIEAEVDKAWRGSMALAKQIDAARGVVPFERRSG